MSQGQGMLMTIMLIYRYALRELLLNTAAYYMNELLFYEKEQICVCWVECKHEIWKACNFTVFTCWSNCLSN